MVGIGSRSGGRNSSTRATIWTLEKQSRVVKSAERGCNSVKVREERRYIRGQMLEK